jgi:hypothetical protein
MQSAEKPTDSEITRALAARVIKHAFQDRMADLDSRTALIILKHELFSVSRNAPLDKEVLAALDTPWESRLQGSATGPLIVVWHRGKQILCELRLLLLDPEAQIRRAAFAELRRLLDSCSHLVSPETRARIMNTIEAATRDDRSEALTAAIETTDLLDDDYLYQLTGLRECAALKLPEIGQGFLQRLLFPDGRSLQFLLGLPVWSPRRQLNVVNSLVSRMVADAPSLGSLLREYFRFFGHLALAGAVSAGGVVDQWCRTHETPVDPYTEISDWARNNGSPLAQYHRCETLSRQPGWLNDQQRRQWLISCAAVIRGPTHEGPWKQRLDLARHYCRHIETLYPESDGERVASTAWWLAEQLGAVVATFDHKGQIQVLETIAAACRASDEAWLLGRPSMQPSKLRYATLFSGSLWATSLLAALSESHIRPSIADSRVFADAVGALVAKPAFVHLGFPNDVDGVTYAFENETTRLVNWIYSHLRDADLAARLQRLDQFTNQARHTSDFAGIIREWHPSDDFEELLIAHELRVAAYCSPSLAENLWRAFSDPEWRQRVLLGCTHDNVELVCSAALELECVDNGHQWREYLPHYFALPCVQAGIDRNRRQLLFAYVVSASLTANSVSAVQRVLTHSMQLDLVDLVQKWRERIEHAAPIVPPWIGAKLRALKSILYY